MTDTLPAPLWLDEAKMLAAAVVAEVGADHIDPQAAAQEDCVYVDEDKDPACIVARILHRHGVPTEVLELWEGKAAIDMGPAGVRVYDLDSAGYRFVPGPTAALLSDQATADFLEALQKRQDVGQSWGDALRHALPLEPLEQ